MEKVVLDSSLRAALKGVNEQVALCDEGGQPLAYVLPADMYREMLAAWANSVFGDEAELEQARQEVRAKGGVSGAEILAHLQDIARARSGEP
jgi:hypothetical protein